eukprot:gnl/Dysnectes_brevis/1370_a1539_2672.p1 GENE.gnl/Dysnectes_brevis/1370_a1539_2672~~gnl/Dysnectes_brevis/1370_a1539_2672.p1  ORF type:complete len:632 (+),score=220.00 gnl/Dysnectes_brevis/1370_a1539_2672:1596-3491(+)
MKLTAAQIQQLGRETRFTDDEIEKMATNFPSFEVGVDAFNEALTSSGIKSEFLQRRIWHAVDVDGSGEVDVVEMIKLMNTLRRATVEELADFFFRIYAAGAESLSAADIELVYIEMLKTAGVEGHIDQAKFSAAIKAMDLNDDGMIDQEEFRAAVQASVKASNKKEPLTAAIIFRNTWLVLCVSLFEIAVSFGIPVISAISGAFKDDMGLTESDIGSFTGVYFIGAIIGPGIGGWLMDQTGPCLVVTIANVVVTIAACVCALAVSAKSTSLFLIGRLLLGLGGEATPFTTIECLSILWPDKFLFMAGYRNLVQSGSGFLAFILLPMIYEKSGSLAATNWFIALLGVVAIVANLFVWMYISKQKALLASRKSPIKAFKALGQKGVPRNPSKLAEFKMPGAFWLAVVGIKCFYLSPFAFTSYSNSIFTDPERFALSESTASFLSGFISLLAGLFGPIAGPLSDSLGRRSIWLAIFVGFAVTAYALFYAVQTELIAWIGVCFLALSYGWGDTVSYASIRLIVGAERAGIGYGCYALLGNLISFLVPTLTGIVYDKFGADTFLIVFASIMLFGTLCWVGVRLLMGPKAILELKAKDIVTTDDEELEAATLHAMLSEGVVLEPTRVEEVKPVAEVV